MNIPSITEENRQEEFEARMYAEAHSALYLHNMVLLDIAYQLTGLANVHTRALVKRLRSLGRLQNV